MKKYMVVGAAVFLLFSVSILFHPEDREIPTEMQGETAAERMDGEGTDHFIREGSFYRDENGNFVFRMQKDPAFDGTAEAAGGRSDVFVLSPLDEPTENTLKQTVDTLRAGGENTSIDWETANVLRAHLKLDYTLCGSEDPAYAGETFCRLEHLSGVYAMPVEKEGFRQTGRYCVRGEGRDGYPMDEELEITPKGHSWYYTPPEDWKPVRREEAACAGAKWMLSFKTEEGIREVDVVCRIF